MDESLKRQIHEEYRIRNRSEGTCKQYIFHKGTILNPATIIYGTLLSLRRMKYLTAYCITALTHVPVTITGTAVRTTAADSSKSTFFLKSAFFLVKKNPLE